MLQTNFIVRITELQQTFWMPGDQKDTSEQAKFTTNQLEHNAQVQDREDWLLVDKNQDAHLARDSLATKNSEKLNKKSSSSSKESIKSPAKVKEKLDTNFVFDVQSDTADRKLISYQSQLSSTSDEMSTKEQQEEAAMQSTYDAIEDSLYKAIDKDTSTGSGKRVHTGNYRMKEKSEKVTTRDANAANATTSSTSASSSSS